VKLSCHAKKAKKNPLKKGTGIMTVVWGIVAKGEELCKLCGLKRNGELKVKDRHVSRRYGEVKQQQGGKEERNGK